MKDGANYARRIKSFASRLSRLFKEPPPREPRPVIEELLYAILARETSDERAARALEALYQNTVDLNELRVTTPREIVRMMGEDLPEVAAKAEEIGAVLRDVVRRQGRLDLSSLKDRGLREAREYLETLQGVSPFAAAWVFSRSLGGHAIAVDENMVRFLRAERLVPEKAELADVQALLERNVSASISLRFQAALRQRALQRQRSGGKGGRAGPRHSSSPSPSHRSAKAGTSRGSASGRAARARSTNRQASGKARSRTGSAARASSSGRRRP